MWWRRNSPGLRILALGLIGLACASGCGDSDDDDDDDGGEGGESGENTTGKGGTAGGFGKGGTGGTAGGFGKGGSGATGGSSATGGTGAQPSGPLPDLFFSTFYAEDHENEDESGAFVQFAFGNQGEADAPQPHTLSIVISADDTIGNDDDIEIFEMLVDQIIPAPTVLETFGFSNEGFVAIDESVDDGTYLVGAILDRDEQIAESDEGNNFASSNTIFVGQADHDIEATELDFDPAELAAGDEFTVSVSVEAVGNLPVEAVPVNVLLSEDDSLDADDDLIVCSGSTGRTLEVGDAASLEISCNVPRVRGEYYLGVQVDPEETLDEQDRDNNVLFTDDPIEITAPDLDLTLSEVTVGALEVEWDGDLEVTATVANSGPDASGNFQLGFYLSRDAELDDDDTLLCQRAVTSIAAEATAVVSTTCTLPGSIAGDVRLIAHADTTDILFELDEDNNALTASGTLAVAGPDADLAYVLHNITTATPLTLGSEFGMALQVQNPGADAVPGLAVNVYFSTDDTITDTDDLACTDTLGEVPASTVAQFTFTCDVPEDLEPGQYYVGVILDPDNEFPETNESNNRGVDQASRQVLAE